MIDKIISMLKDVFDYYEELQKISRSKSILN